MPMAWPRNVATTAPTIPNSAVTMKPPGSRPGIRNLATIPTMKPMMTAQMMLMISPFAILNCCRMQCPAKGGVGSVGGLRFRRRKGGAYTTHPDHPGLLRASRARTTLLDGDALGEVAGLVHVRAAAQRRVVSQQLHRNRMHDR